jgi:hypothetical protein
MTASPVDHPNAFATVSSGSVALFLVHEAKTRLGVDLTMEEAGYIVIGVSTTVLFFGRRLSARRAK